MVDVHDLMLRWSFTEFVRPDRYPRPVAALIDRDDEGLWQVQQVGRWDDARESERRYGELPIDRWRDLEWVR